MTFEIQGLIVPAITPRILNGSSESPDRESSDSLVDLHSMARLTEFLIDGGVDSIFILGTTGEFSALSIEEKQHVIEYAAASIRNRVPMLVGISAETIDQMLALIGIAEEHSTQALVLAPMFGGHDPSEQIRIVLEHTSLPIVLYNNPAIHTNTGLPFRVVEEFASDPRVIGIKDSSGDWQYFLKLLTLQSTRFRVVHGKETTILDSLEAGAAGIVAGLANIVPSLCKQVFLHRNQKNMDSIMAVKSELKRLFPDSISGYKYRLVQYGVINSAALWK